MTNTATWFSFAPPTPRLWDLRLGVASKPLVGEGIGISIELDFIDAGSHQVDFISAGCEFVPGRSVIDPDEDVFAPT